MTKNRMNSMIKKLFNNLGAKFLCFILAIVFYSISFYISFQHRTVSIPLSIILPENFKPISNIPQSTNIILKGDEKVLYTIDPLKIDAVADFSFVNQPGVYTTKVILNYESGIFSETNLTINAQPLTCKIAFDNI